MITSGNTQGKRYNVDREINRPSLRRAIARDIYLRICRFHRNFPFIEITHDYFSIGDFRDRFVGYFIIDFRIYEGSREIRIPFHSTNGDRQLRGREIPIVPARCIERDDRHGIPDSRLYRELSAR